MTTDGSGIAFSIDAPRHIRTAVYSGVITEELFLRTYEEMISAEDYDPTLNELVDLTRVQRLEVGSAGLNRFVSMLSQPGLQAESKVAIVAPAGGHIFGMARMYEFMSADALEQIQVFDDMNEAFEWLTSAMQ